MYTGVSPDLLLSVAKANGYMQQLKLDLDCPPFVFVKPEYLTSLNNCIEFYDANGRQHKVISVVDHPSFTQTRQWLANNGYISMDNTCWNADRVLKPFYFNNTFMDKGNRFCCASALKYQHGTEENYNDGKPKAPGL